MDYVNNYIIKKHKYMLLDYSIFIFWDNPLNICSFVGFSIECNMLYATSSHIKMDFISVKLTSYERDVIYNSYTWY